MKPCSSLVPPPRSPRRAGGGVRPATGMSLLVAMLATVFGACDAGPDPAGGGDRVAADVQTPALATVARTPRRVSLPPLQSVQEEVDASRRTAIVRASERVAPAVVSVNVLRRQRVQRPMSIWEGFFLPPAYERRVSGVGSGFIIREDGLVLTNEHVVRDAIEVLVTLPDGREFPAEVVGSDHVTDLALLRIDAPEGVSLPVAPLGDSDELLIGEWVVAIGNPLGFVLSNTEPTVTVGVVSGVGRDIIPGGENEGGYYLDMIQTDAAINPGNSGGPLVNALGAVVGVNASIISRSGGSEGLGFAIPITRARSIALDLLDDGMVQRAWVGLEVASAGSNMGDDNGGDRWGRRRPVTIADVAPGSPAAEAGLEPGTVLRSAGNQPVSTPLDWESVLLDARVGEPIQLAVGAGEDERRVRLVPAPLPSLTAERIQALEDFELVTLTPAIRAELGLVSEEGALIVSLSDAARRLGLRERDLILQINRNRIRTAEEAATLLRRLTGRGGVRLVFERDGRYGSTSFTITA